MPTWGEILVELQGLSQKHGLAALDLVRRKYLSLLAKLTGRNVILYATRWTQGGEPYLISITPEDMQGFMEVVHGLQGDKLDLILHSPGGSAEATESIVLYLRTKFSDVRVFVPHAAMSAATMLTCSGNRIVMGKHSFLGPIDPQFIVDSEIGERAVPAHAILEQFALAQQQCKDPSLIASWLPILQQYGPALIVQCQLAQSLSLSLVSRWLNEYMFKGQEASQDKAEAIAKKLADHALYKSHGRFLPRESVKALGLVIDDLEADQKVQDAVLSVFHATAHTFSATTAAKVIENHTGKAFVKNQIVNAPAAPPPSP